MVNKAGEVSENLCIKVHIEKIEMQHLGGVDKDFNTVIKNQNLLSNQSLHLSIWEKT